ncbi:MAG: hypothetical protein CMF69_06555 [Magnetovibrio sp.]|nr:hypothetical protein [Magnetovibrio sp.]|tara:strand:- start:402 stop:1361 length:960 start_codon:yes stop_codon:yes gene_type:complete
MNRTSPIIGWADTLNSLQNGLFEEERSRSAYWDEESEKFTVDANGEIHGVNSMGTVSRKRDMFHQIAHWTLLSPFRLLGLRYNSFSIHLQNGYAIARMHHRLFTHDMLRQVLVISLLDHYLPLSEQKGCGLIIGDGYGILTSLFLRSGYMKKIVTCNLTKSLLLDLTEIKKSSPKIGVALASTTNEIKAAFCDDSIRLIAVQADNAEIIREMPVNIATNVHSMMEMEPNVINAYFNILRSNKSDQTAFYCANRLYKKLQGGTVTRFMEYPWDKNDKILHDSVSHWSQWNINKTPPFLHYRFGKSRKVWHRLAILKMSPR